MNQPDIADVIPISPPQESPVASRPLSRTQRLLTIAALGTITPVASAGAGMTATEMVMTHNLNPISAAQHIGKKMLNELGVTDCPPIPEGAVMVTIQQEINTPQRQSFREARTAAEDNGMLFAQAKSSYDMLRNADTPLKATEAASAYMEQEYGFDLVLDLSDKKQTGINQDRYNQALMDMALYTSVLPTELLRAADLSRIEFTDLYDQTQHDVDGKSLGDFGQFKATTRTVTLDINNIDNVGIFMHEVMGHALQNTACGGAESEDDPALSGQNPTGFSYTDNETSFFDQVTEDTTASGYGKKNVREDNAELAATFISGANVNYLQSLTGTSADNKLAVILNRYNAIVPGSSAYLSAARTWFRDMKPFSDEPIYTAPQN